MAFKSYEHIAWIYEHLGTIYSGGQIYAAKASQIAEMRPGDKVLYAGVGPGEDALLAARLGTQLTCIDLAGSMLEKTERRLAAEGLAAELLQVDIMTHERPGYYDVVVVNFFLNVFSEPVVKRMLAHLVTLVRPEGKLLICDFAAAQGNAFARALQEVYWGVTDGFYALMGLAALHSVYDYTRYFPEVGLDLVSVRQFRPYGFLPCGFSAITARRPPVAPTS
jgi:ubiquinone/menaquinone biosynthesis C-methylase UbiE